MKKTTPLKISFGTATAAKARAVANNFTDEKREQLMNLGMSIIYGGNKSPGPKANARRP